MRTSEQNPFSSLGKAAGNLVARKLVKLAAKATHKAILFVLKATAPIWVPLLIVLLISYGAYMILYGIPREAIESNIGGKTLVAAFFGTLEDDEIVTTNERLFEEYRELSETWAEGLTERQKDQIIIHKFPWSILVATDRVVKDTAVWEGKENVEIQPMEVFEVLRPQFEWKQSTITTETVSCWYEELEESDEEDTEDDDSSAEGSSGGVVCSEDTRVDKVTLISRASTLEGDFEYIYEWQTDVTYTDDHGGSVTVTREVLKETKSPQEYFLPWISFLASKGITDESTIDLIKELAVLYDDEYRFNHSLVTAMDYSSYPVIEGSNGWIWPTPSIRITSAFGPRTYPRSGFHQGVDIGASNRGKVGDPIWSIDDGVVVFSAYSGGYGNVVFVDHGDDIVSAYAHLNQRFVSVGSIVQKGDLLGTMGNTGYSTGPHLHFEIRQGEKRFDPVFFFLDILF